MIFFSLFFWFIFNSSVAVLKCQWIFWMLMVFLSFVRLFDFLRRQRGESWFNLKRVKCERKTRDPINSPLSLTSCLSLPTEPSQNHFDSIQMRLLTFNKICKIIYRNWIRKYRKTHTHILLGGQESRSVQIKKNSHVLILHCHFEH